MSRILRNILAAVVLASGPGACHRSGTWNDAPANWDRAFQTTKPADVVVVHSRYWRSPHWTYEFEYFFHIRTNAALSRQLFEQNSLKKLDGAEREIAFGHFAGAKPAWFLPGPADRYEAWAFRDEPGRNFRVFVERETGDLFLADYCL